MQPEIVALLEGAGLRLRHGGREYRPSIGLDDFEVKLLKPQNIVEMLHAGSRDLGFAGADWVAELNADLVELLDTGFNPVTLVAAAPATLVDLNQPLIVASEYVRIADGWMKRRGLGDKFVRSYGATEVFPPEDADCIIDIAASGATLRANGLVVVDELMQSSTKLYANRQALEDPLKRSSIEGFVLLIKSVLDARNRVMLEMNVESGLLETLTTMLPCMREPTVSPLHHSAGYAVKVAVRRSEVPLLIPRIKAAGGTDIVITELAQIVA